MLIYKKSVSFALNFVNPLMYFSHFFEDISSFETNSNNICFRNLNSKKPFVLKFKTFLTFWNLFLRARSTLALNTCFRDCSHSLTKVKLSLNFNQSWLNLHLDHIYSNYKSFFWIFSLPLIQKCFILKIEIM